MCSRRRDTQEKKTFIFYIGAFGFIMAMMLLIPVEGSDRSGELTVRHPLNDTTLNQFVSCPQFLSGLEDAAATETK